MDSELADALKQDDAAEDRGMHGDDRATCHQCQSWIDHAHDPSPTPGSPRTSTGRSSSAAAIDRDPYPTEAPMSTSTRAKWREQERRLQDALTQLDEPGIPQDDPRSLATYAQLEAHHDDQPVLDRVGQIIDWLRGHRWRSEPLTVSGVLCGGTLARGSRSCGRANAPGWRIRSACAQQQ